MTPVVEIDRLSKRYGQKWAVRDVTLAIPRNQVFGMLGPNGSGKTTILRTLTGYLEPTEGRVSVAGFDLSHESLEARRKVGYVPEDVPLYPGMRVDEFLRFMGGLRGLSGAPLKAAVARVADQLSLGDVRRLAIAKLSRGYRQRLMIAQALLGQPELLILDEPTNGLDPRQIIEVRELIRTLSADHTVLLTSHILSEIEKVANRVAILLDGRLLAVHDLDDKPTLRVRIKGPDPEAIGAMLTALPAVKTTATSGLIEDGITTHFVTLAAPDATAAIADAVAESGYELIEMSTETTPLETLFLELTDGARA